MTRFVTTHFLYRWIRFDVEKGQRHNFSWRQNDDRRNQGQESEIGKGETWQHVDYFVGWTGRCWWIHLSVVHLQTPRNQTFSSSQRWVVTQKPTNHKPPFNCYKNDDLKSFSKSSIYLSLCLIKHDCPRENKMHFLENCTEISTFFYLKRKKMRFVTIIGRYF